MGMRILYLFSQETRGLIVTLTQRGCFITLGEAVSQAQAIQTAHVKPIPETVVTGLMMPTFTASLEQAWNERPDMPAITLLQAGKPDVSLSTREMLCGAAGYAQTLAQAGIRPGEVVVLILQHSLEHIYAYYGAILHGAIPSIMPFLTEKLLPERYRADLAALVAVTRPAAILTYPEFEGEVRASLAADSSVRAVLLTSQALPPCDPDFSALGGSRRRPEDIVLLQHSSGTTGLQKGVALSHQAVFNQLHSYARAIQLNPADVIVSWLPLYHDMGLIAGFLMPALLHIPLVLLSPFDWVRAPARLMQAVSRYHGTLSWMPNFAFSFCAQKTRDRDLQDVDLSSWRAVINCSEPVRWESIQDFTRRFAAYGLHPLAASTCYAMAENTFAVTQSALNEPVRMEAVDRDRLQMDKLAIPAGEQPAIEMVSTGKPIEQVQVKVVDAAGASLPERQVGEVAVRSHCMLTGYYNRPDATEKALAGDWYLTGDYGYLAEGELFITGRKKDLIIVGGKNIYPQDLEMLAMTVPGVHAGRVVAFGVMDEKAGTEEVYMVAEADEADAQQRELIADTLRKTVTQGSAVALRGVRIVDAGWIIKTSSGKTARSANRDKFLSELQSV